MSTPRPRYPLALPPRLSLDSFARRAQQIARATGVRVVGQGQEQVLDRDVLVLEPGGLPLGRVEQPGEPLGDEHLAGRGARPGRAGPARQLGLEPGAQRVGVGAEPLEQAGHEPFGLVQQGEQQVLAVDLGMAEPQRLGLRVVQRLLGLLGQAVHVHGVPLLPGGCGRARASRPAARRAVSSVSMRSSRSSTSPIAA